MKISATHHLYFLKGGGSADITAGTLTTTGLNMRYYGGVEICAVGTAVDSGSIVYIYPFENTATTAGGTALSDAAGTALTFSATAGADSMVVCHGYVDASLLSATYTHICAKVTAAGTTTPCQSVLIGTTARYSQATMAE